MSRVCLRTFGRRAILVAVTWAASSSAVRSQDCWRFLYSESSTPSSSRAESRRGHTEVFLLPEAMILKLQSGDGALEAIAYDFKSRRIRSYAGGRLVSDRSMLGDVHVRALEIRNRSVLGGILEGAGVKSKDSPLSLLDAETELGVELPDRHRKVTMKRDGGTFAYHADDTVLARCTFASDPLPTAATRRLASFLAHRCRVHPAVRREIVAQKRLPLRIEAFAVEPMTRASKTTLMEFKELARSAPPAALVPRTTTRSDAETLEIMGAVLGDVPKGKRVTPAALIAVSDKALKDGKYLDAFLALIEIGWIDDSKVPMDRVKAVMAAGADDPPLRTYLTAVRSKDPAETRRLLQSIPRKGLIQAHALDVNEAATYHSEKRPREGIEIYKRAVRSQPWMAGPWKDLGDLLAATYDPGAWDCYDVARAVCATHSMLRGVNEMERNLAADFPDFF